MISTTIFDFVSLFFAGMLAGIEFVIHYGLRGLTEVLDERSQLQFRQALILRLRVLVPACFVPTAVLGIAVTLLNGIDAGFWFRCAAILALLSWIVVRVVATVRINSDTLTWRLDAPPKNWQTLVNHAERFHNVGVWAAIMAFAFLLTATALKLTAH